MIEMMHVRVVADDILVGPSLARAPVVSTINGRASFTACTLTNVCPLCRHGFFVVIQQNTKQAASNVLPRITLIKVKS